ncbi:MAG: 30S ribosomal protein S20 [Patescibacteria group bacterium]
MPITKSAKKALRVSKRKHEKNVARKNEMKRVLKDFRKIAPLKGEEGKIALSLAYKALDKAAKTGIIKKNTASRKKSRLAKQLKKNSVK